MIRAFACSIKLLKELKMGTSDLELKYREEALSKGDPNFCQSCAMDLITCDCVNPRPVRVLQAVDDTCPKCRRTKHDWDCAEENCPMAAVTTAQGGSE